MGLEGLLVNMTRPIEVVRETLRANEAGHVDFIVLQLASVASCNLFAQHVYNC
jgi:hypothetical protein